jgi:ABC-type transport system involved in multi-copper enzyme maturation permease subunit
MLLRLLYAWYPFALAVGCLLAIVFFRRRGFPRLFGPVLVYDLVRTARRGQVIWYRCFYALALLLVLYAVYWAWFPTSQWNDLFMASAPVPFNERAHFAETFFQGFILVQLAVLLLITPIYTATAISEEKERRTLEFILVTELSDREIVLGVWAARVGTLLLLALTGLPVLAILQFLGGVDPNRVLMGFASIAVAVISLGSFCVLCSTQCKTSAGAVFAAYFGGIVLLVPLTGLMLTVLLSDTLIGPGLWYLSAHFIIHVIITFLCAGWAIAVLRPRSGSGPLSQPWSRVPIAVKALSTRRLPRVGPNALLWKEMYAERYIEPASPADYSGCFVFMVVIAIVSLLPLLGFSNMQDNVQAGIQVWVERLGTAVASLMLLGIGVSAAARVSREREKGTLSGLLVLPEPTAAILFSKWLGSILSVRWLFWVLGAVWAFGAVTGALSVVALPWLAAAWIVEAGFVAALGIWFSVYSRTTLRAYLFVVLVVLVFICGPGTFYRLVAGDIYDRFGNIARPWTIAFLDQGLTPALTLRALAFRAADFDSALPSTKYMSADWSRWQQLLAALGGLHLYMACTAVVGVLAWRRLKAEPDRSG